MLALKAILRWVLAVLLAMGAVGGLFTGHLLGALVGLIGCTIITPQGGEWVAGKVSALTGGTRQVVIGFVVFIVGMMMSMPSNLGSSDSMKPADAVAQSPAAPKFQCEAGTSSDGEIVGVIGADGHELHKTPKGEKIVNTKATKILGETNYQSIDNSTKVQVQCVDGDWARIQITDPEWLKEQVGWVEKSALALPLKPGEVRDFTESDFLWDKDTKNVKSMIVKTVNRIHREDPRCKDDIYPSSVAKSGTERKGKKSPVYFVNCGSGASSVNVYFDAKRVDDPKPFAAPGHIDKMRAIDLCEAYAKANASHPSTVDFSRLMDMAYSEHPNGRSQVLSSFTAKNAYNLELKFRIKCLFDGNGFIEGNVWEDGK